MADQPVDLQPERNEGDEIDDAESAQKPIARCGVAWSANVITPQQSRCRGCDHSPPGNECVGAIRNWRDPRKIFVQPKQSASALRMAERAKYRFRATEHVA